MKKILGIIALGALIVTSSMGVANAQQGSRGYYGMTRGGWNCPWMGGQGGYARSGGWGGNRQGRGWHMGPRTGQNSRGTGGNYGPQYRAGR